MARELVIVESPAKARTVGGFLGKNYTVKATLGHVRDLPKSRLGVDVDEGFSPKYLVPRDKRAALKEIKAAAKGASVIYLATDPDREGEAISWHLVKAAELDESLVRRVVFHEITRDKVEEAMANPTAINMQLVNAQQARRILDRLVGYSISPLLWRKVRGRLSAGRVQSAALRMIVEREREIEGFTPQEYWSIEAELSKADGAVEAGRGRSNGNGRRSGARANPSFRASFVGPKASTPRRGRMDTKLEIKSQAEADTLVSLLRDAGYSVAQVRKGKTSRRPQPPFTTSTLQQEAYRRLRFTSQRTMVVAQQLYEGLPLGREGSVGLITYMRTDSTRVADSAVHEAREFIRSKHGEEYVPKSPNTFARRAKGAQEAHEAIRPTSVFREPEAVRPHLSSEQFRLYELVWRRMVASQAAPQSIETTSVDIEAQPSASAEIYIFRASQSRVTFPGFAAIYRESSDEDDNAKQTPLPPLAGGDDLRLLGLDPNQHFTQPPPKYTDATLVKALEDNGIGRPSTYASILSTLLARGYVTRAERQLRALEMGLIVNDLLTEHFPSVVDTGFTAQMEDHLDEIAEGNEDWVQVLHDFYEPFSQAVEQAQERIERIELPEEPTGEACELCGKPLLVRQGRFGKFIGCSGFPACRNTKPILDTIGVECPSCHGELVSKRSRRGRVFYGCAKYPSCDFTSWDRPLPEPCPNCGGLLLQKGNARSARCSRCEQMVDIDSLQPVALEV